MFSFFFLFTKNKVISHQSFLSNCVPFECIELFYCDFLLGSHRNLHIQPPIFIFNRKRVHNEAFMFFYIV